MRFDLGIEIFSGAEKEELLARSSFYFLRSKKKKKKEMGPDSKGKFYLRVFFVFSVVLEPDWRWKSQLKTRIRRTLVRGGFFFPSCFGLSLVAVRTRSPFYCRLLF